MRKADVSNLPDDDLGRYDWSKATRGRHAARAARASALLRMLEPDLAKHFPDSKSVNDALRLVVEIGQTLVRKRTRTRRAA